MKRGEPERIVYRGRIEGSCGLRPPVAAKERTVDEILAQLAGRSHGVVTRRELLTSGVTRHEIQQRMETGALLAIHRGVFRVGHAAPSLEARYLAAVKACGPGSLLAGLAAAHLLHLLKRPPSLPEVLTARHRRPTGVRVHRCRSIDRRDSTTWRGVPVTNVPRTLVDLAAVLEPPELARAFHQAVVRHKTKPPAVERVLRRRHNWPGSRELRRVIWGGEPVSLSKLESSFMALLRDARLSLPRTNIPVGAYYVDCRWPETRLTVELDSYAYHGTRHAWEHDRHREREARARGDEFRRYTWRDVVEDTEPTLADLRALLKRQLTLAA
jgi:very-short-patch-repair endonuclease